MRRTPWGYRTTTTLLRTLALLLLAAAPVAAQTTDAASAAEEAAIRNALENYSAVRADCPGEDAFRPGRWLVESRRYGEPPARGRADIQRLDDGCILVERLILHFEDGTSHHVVFISGSDSANGVRSMVQIGDHPLFLVWEQQDPSTARYRTVRPADGGKIKLEWRMRSTADGFQRQLLLRRWRQIVFGYEGGVWEWDVDRAARGWLLTPTGEMAGRLRIIEQREASGPGFTKRIERLGDDGVWRVRRLIRYVPW